MSRSQRFVVALKSVVVGHGLFPWLRSSPVFIIATLVIYATASTPSTDSSEWSVLAVGLATIAAALIAGATIGFLFGLPKALDQAEAHGLLKQNTNLDKVSDWLTTILIGLGLVQLGAVASGVSNLSESIAPGLGDGPGAETVAVALLVYSAVDGFLIGYLWTRIGVTIRLNEVAQILQRSAEVADAAARETTPPAPVPPAPPAPGDAPINPAAPVTTPDAG